MNKNNHGGRRSKAGRKKLPESEKKIPVVSHHKQCDIDKIGGIEYARDLAYTAIEKKITKT